MHSCVLQMSESSNGCPGKRKIKAAIIIEESECQLHWI